MGGDAFRPAEPQTIEETGLSPVGQSESSILKFLLQVGSATGREIAWNRLCLPFRLLEDMLLGLAAGRCWSTRAVAAERLHLRPHRRRRRLRPRRGGGAPRRSRQCRSTTTLFRSRPRPSCAERSDAATWKTPSPTYRSTGRRWTCSARPSTPAPDVPLRLGTGKTTIAKRITRCFGQHLWIPQTIVEDGDIIKLSPRRVPRSGSLRRIEHPEACRSRPPPDQDPTPHGGLSVSPRWTASRFAMIPPQTSPRVAANE